MDLTAIYDFDAPAQKVWDLLMNTDAVGGCLPGSQGLHAVGEDRYEVELGVAVAAISGNFKGTVAIQDKIPPQSYTLLVEGSGRPGFVKGQARVLLEPDGERTRVHVSAHADAGGMIARVGQRLLEGVARTTMDRFFACFAKQL
jgi:carbon monoxide dehydrogenase subunit G